MADPIRLFFALWPDDGIRAAIAAAGREVAARQGFEGKPVPPGRLHLTLLFLGDLEARHLEPARAAAARLHQAGFRLTLDQAGCFHAARVGWLGPRQAPPALTRLWLALREAMAAAGVPHERRTLAPHVTLLRRARAALRPVPVAPIEWPVREFVLAHSVSQPRPEYRVVERYALRDAEAAPPVKSGETVRVRE